LNVTNIICKNFVKNLHYLKQNIIYTVTVVTIPVSRKGDNSQEIFTTILFLYLIFFKFDM